MRQKRSEKATGILKNTWQKHLLSIQMEKTHNIDIGGFTQPIKLRFILFVKLT